MSDFRQKYESAYKRWNVTCERLETVLSSSDEAYLNNAEFRAIVQMGENVLPYIFETLQRDQTAHLLIHALEKITNKRFTQQEIEIGQSRYGTPLGNQGFAAMWQDWWYAQQADKGRKT